MIASGGLDILDICTPAHLHARLAISALRSGINVIVEKPMAMSFKEAEAVLREVKRSGLKYTVMQNYRFQKTTQTVKEILDSNTLGQIVLVHSKFYLPPPRLNADISRRQTQFNPAFACGVLFETGVHDIDLTYHLLGPITKVYAIGRMLVSDSFVDDICVVNSCRDGIISINETSFAQSFSSHQFQIFGTSSRLFFDFYRNKIALERGSGLKTSLSQMVEAIAQLTRPRLFKRRVGLSSRHLQKGFDIVIDEFVSSILYGGRPPVTADEACEVMRILEGARLSHLQRTAKHVEEV